MDGGNPKEKRQSYPPYQKPRVKSMVEKHVAPQTKQDHCYSIGSSESWQPTGYRTLKSQGKKGFLTARRGH
jgi:hypothetical protein